MTVADFFEGIRQRHLEQVARGEHDEQCEYHVEGFYLCNCAKRRRIASGFTEEPGDLYFPPPACPRCDKDLDWDDRWICRDCSVSWSNDGTDAEFTDDNGDDLAEQSAKWAEAHLTPKETPCPT